MVSVCYYTCCVYSLAVNTVRNTTTRNFALPKVVAVYKRVQLLAKYSAMRAVSCLMMEWNDHYVCVTIFGLLKVGHGAQKIFSLLCSLKITQRVVECVKQCYEEIEDVVDCSRRGRSHSACIKKMKRSRIKQNPCVEIRVEGIFMHTSR